MTPSDLPTYRSLLLEVVAVMDNEERTPEEVLLMARIHTALGGSPQGGGTPQISPPDSSLVTDAEVYVARKAYTASGGQWPGVKHMRAALEAVKSKP